MGVCSVVRVESLDNMLVLEGCRCSGIPLLCVCMRVCMYVCAYVCVWLEVKVHLFTAGWLALYYREHITQGRE